MIIINGQQFTEEEYEKLQEQQYQKLIAIYDDYKKQYNCNNAVIPFPFDVNSPPAVVCSLDSIQITLRICNNCKAKNV